MVTANAQLLLGYILGGIGGDRIVISPDAEGGTTMGFCSGDMYRIVRYDAEGGTAVIERTTTKNQYLVKVEQVSGEE